MRDAVLVFPSVILLDKRLLAFLDALPVCLERHVEDGATSKHCSSCVGVALVVVCTVERAAWRMAPRMPRQPNSFGRSFFPLISSMSINWPTT